jgi:hypothetical protein
MLRCDVTLIESVLLRSARTTFSKRVEIHERRIFPLGFANIKKKESLSRFWFFVSRLSITVMCLVCIDGENMENGCIYSVRKSMNKTLLYQHSGRVGCWCDIRCVVRAKEAPWLRFISCAEELFTVYQLLFDGGFGEKDKVF